METTNQPVDQWRETLEKILQYYADLPYTYGDVITYLIISAVNFLIYNYRPNAQIHIEIINQKLWLN